MSRNATLFALCLVALGGCGAKKKEAQESDAAQQVQVAQATRESIERVVHADAILFPLTQSAITPKVSAPVKKFFVNRGDHVKAGELLAILENRDLESSLDENRALVDQAEAQAATLVRGTIPEDTTKAQTDVESARQNLNAAKNLYNNRVALVKEGALAQKLADDAKVALVQAQSASDNAERHLQSLNTVSRTEQIRNAQGQVAAAKARYTGAQAQVAYTEIRSPIDGVVADRPAYAGEMASAGNPLITIVDISEVVARANVPAFEVVDLKPGEKATITAAGTDLDGTVTVVSPSVDPSSTTVEVWIRARNPGGKFKPGTSAKVVIQAGTVGGAVVVPRSALLSSDEGGPEVMVVDGQSVAHERKVTVGVRSDDRVQIAEGLQPGENVVTVGGVGLADNAKVEVSKPE